MIEDLSFQCPVPLDSHRHIQLAHGGGGRIARKLLEGVFLPALSNPALDEHHDAGVVSLGAQRLAFTTDGFVVSPWRFPGGDIGSLAVHGTVNDLAMAGAKPLAMSAAFILEEGFSTEDLAIIAQSMRRAADEAGISVVAGDTKVVERGKGDGIYIGAAGVGQIVARNPVLPSSVRPGDAVLLSGDVGRHGVAVMSVRDGLDIETSLESDSALVHEPVLALLSEGVDVSCLRDVTRGGLATILNEIARDAGVRIRIEEGMIPVHEEVASICEILGLDPFYVACEGRFVTFVEEAQADRALEVMRRFGVSQGAMRIGQVVEGPAQVTIESRLGIARVLDLLSGEQLPRIC